MQDSIDEMNFRQGNRENLNAFDTLRGQWVSWAA
jgi:hypothetical protein